MLFTRPSYSTEQMVKDKISIKELIEFERFCRDNAQWEEMRKCFSPDSIVRISWFTGTGDSFVDASIKMDSYAPHKLYNTIIELNNNKAVAATMATIQIRANIDGCIVELQSDLKLLYRLQKASGVWSIVAMEGIYEKDSLQTCSGGNFSISAHEISEYRTSYAYLSYFLKRNGFEINMDLPGIDIPESVQRIYKESEDWLHE
ncbi:nuclear transport factor 2 family protein [Clostridium sp. BL-8]|uniref:nuclear transport factor 2 family protein n=1 Tax=Clostridium sp. BL-8 TaxID=349938 RepID=UPI00098C9FD8|nr:nuclear transport factor 2 family protein [Clostridium sp. BL-8]OOM81120.1 hypothetical protein CLOBL_04100 [Clostridium sp. BL-8]